MAEIELDARDVHTVEDVFRLLEERYEDIVKMRPFIRVAINHEYAVIEDVIKPGDELALITPVSGG